MSILTSRDLVVGAVLLRGVRAPRVVTEVMVRIDAARLRYRRCQYRPGRLCGNIASDHASRPGIRETRRYSLLRSEYARRLSANFNALTDATLPYTLRLADNGIDALQQDHGLARGVNTHKGYLTCKAVAESLDRMPHYREFS